MVFKRLIELDFAPGLVRFCSVLNKTAAMKKMKLICRPRQKTNSTRSTARTSISTSPCLKDCFPVAFLTSPACEIHTVFWLLTVGADVNRKATTLTKFHSHLLPFTVPLSKSIRPWCMKWYICGRLSSGIRPAMATTTKNGLKK